MDKALYNIKKPQPRHFWRKLPLIPITIMTIVVLVAILADIIAPYSPEQMSLEDRLTPPFFVSGGSLAHPLGTDAIGRDILSQYIKIARHHFEVAW